MAVEYGNERGTRAEAFYSGLGDHHVAPLWRASDLLLPEPVSKAVPHVWRYLEMRRLLLESGEVVTAEEAERRVLMLMNPGLDGEAAAATNLYAGLQLLLPGEVAPKHRHAASALRFIVEGSGAYTTVNGEKTLMHVGDLVLTPNWAWHDHGHESEEPMIWLDGLDIPLVNALETSFFDHSGEQRQELTKLVDASAHLFANARLNPIWERWEHPYSPIVNYPWVQTERALRAIAADTEGSPTDGVILQYVNPYTGGAVVPTMACFVQLLAPGLHTEAHQHTTSAVYHVVRGHGRTIVDGTSLDWQARDTFAVPGWALHEHVNGSHDEEAVLFSFTDEPVLKPLGLYRERDGERQEA